MEEFSFSDLTLIKNMGLTHTYKQIADLLEKPVNEIADVIERTFKGIDNLQTYQDKVDKRNAVRAAMPKKIKVIKPRPASVGKEKLIDPVLVRKKQERERKLAIISQQDERRRVNQESNRSKFVTKKVDYTEMRSLRIDRKTIIYVKDGEDPEEVRARFLLNYKPVND